VREKYVKIELIMMMRIMRGEMINRCEAYGFETITTTATTSTKLERDYKVKSRGMLRNPQQQQPGADNPPKVPGVSVPINSCKLNHLRNVFLPADIADTIFSRCLP